MVFYTLPMSPTSRTCPTRPTSFTAGASLQLVPNSEFKILLLRLALPLVRYPLWQTLRVCQSFSEASPSQVPPVSPVSQVPKICPCGSHSHLPQKSACAARTPTGASLQLVPNSKFRIQNSKFSSCGWRLTPKTLSSPKEWRFNTQSTKVSIPLPTVMTFIFNEV